MIGVGTRLGPYELGSLIGAGGMGEVYQATDTRLGRTVAIKVLPAAVAADPERRARFEREARTVGALSHPNVVAIHDVGSVDDVSFLVMELLEGETLRARLSGVAEATSMHAQTSAPAQTSSTGHGLPRKKAFEIAAQVASGLAAAHARGIVHRDLKPENIFLTSDGRVKILDFGLARALGSGTPNAQTQTTPVFAGGGATAAGVVMGTVGYMAPEQVKGKEADHRADIFALGVVLFEMLTGTRAFASDSPIETMSAILSKDPLERREVSAAIPPTAEGVVRRCLEKQPEERFESARDLAFQLQALASGSTTSGVATVTAIDTPAKANRTWLLAVAGFALLAIGAAVGWTLRPAPSASGSSATQRFIIAPPSDNEVEWPVVTPDGGAVIFKSGSRLYRRPIDSMDAIPIPNTDGAAIPMVSPNGQSIAFFAEGKIKRVALAGGDPIVLTEAGWNMPGSCWCFDDTIVFSRAWSSGLYAVPANPGGGPVKQLTTPDASKNERAHWRPQPLPGGRRVLFSIMMAGTGVNDSQIAVLDLDTGKYRALFPGTDGVYLSSGHILFFHAGRWHVVPFDAASEKATGEPVGVLPDALGVPPDGGGAGHVIAAAGGVLAYLPGPWYPRRELAWIDKKGTVQPIKLPVHSPTALSLSPDGKRTAMTRVEGGTFEVWIQDLTRLNEDRLDVKGSNTNAVWGPHGDWLAFISERKGEYDAYIARPDGSGERALLNKDYDEQPIAWSHDANRILVREWRLDGTTPISLVDAATGGSQTVLLPNTPGGSGAEISPNDRWFVYPGMRGSRKEISVRSLSENGAVTRVSNDGGDYPFWSHDGSEIYFLNDNTIMAASFRETGGKADTGVPHEVLKLPQWTALYGVDADGRFLIGRLVDPAPQPGVRVVLNWDKKQ